MASTMQLEFAQAMSDFKTMFPDMDRDVIEAVLRANQGAVDATIDQLLAMSTDNQNEKLRNELDLGGSRRTDEVPTYSLINLTGPDLISSATTSTTDTSSVQLIDTSDSATQLHSPTPAATVGILENDLLDIVPATSQHHLNNTGASPKQKQTLPFALTTTITTTTAANTQSSAKRSGGGSCNGGGGAGGNGSSLRRWNPPILGPLPPNFLRLQPNPNDIVCGGIRDFDLPDEQFAMMLQNEEFMNELRWNQEFMTALEKEQQDKSKTEDDAAFKERLKHMGKLSRKKFLQMARVFTWQRNKKVTSAKQIDSLPLKEEPSDDEDHLRVRK